MEIQKKRKLLRATKILKKKMLIKMGWIMKRQKQQESENQKKKLRGTD